MITLTPALSRRAADHVQRLTFEERKAFYAALAGAQTEADVAALLAAPPARG